MATSRDVGCFPRLSWGPFLESLDNFSGPESYLICAIFALKTQILVGFESCAIKF